MGKSEANNNLFKILSHPIRVRIIELLHDEIELSYTELLNTLKIDTGHLNFHIKNIGNLYRTTDDGKYVLTDEGKTAYGIIKKAEKLGVTEGVDIEPRASVIKRFAASVIDSAIFLGTPITVTIILSIFIPFEHKNVDVLNFVGYMHALLSLSLAAIVLMETYNGQTIGKYILGIRAIKENERKLTLVESALRNTAKIFFLPLDVLAGLIFYKKLGYWRFTDYYLKTKVVEV